MTTDARPSFGAAGLLETVLSSMNDEQPWRLHLRLRIADVLWATAVIALCITALSTWHRAQVLEQRVTVMVKTKNQLALALLDARERVRELEQSIAGEAAEDGATR